MYFQHLSPRQNSTPSFPPTLLFVAQALVLSCGVQDFQANLNVIAITFPAIAATATAVGATSIEATAVGAVGAITATAVEATSIAATASES